MVLSLRSPFHDSPIHHLKTTDSTMDDARELVRRGASSGTIVVADHQRLGRGRRVGRAWLSEPAESLLFTIALRQESLGPPAGDAYPLRLAAAVAVAVESTCAIAVRVKWPNDLVHDDRKLGGILCDLHAPWLYAGVGLNLRQAAFPPEIAGVATSVSLAGGVVPEREVLLCRILLELRENRETWLGVVRDRLWRIGEFVEMRTGAPGEERVLRGVVEDVTADGRLVLDAAMGAGEPVRVVAGEVSFSRPSAYH